jgi:hypothetical protein
MATNSINTNGGGDRGNHVESNHIKSNADNNSHIKSNADNNDAIVFARLHFLWSPEKGWHVHYNEGTDSFTEETVTTGVDPGVTRWHEASEFSFGYIVSSIGSLSSAAGVEIGTLSIDSLFDWLSSVYKVTKQ